MKQTLLWLAGIGTATILGFGFASSTKPASEEETIRALEQDFAAAVRAKDVDKMMTNYNHSENLVVFDVHPPRQYVGWDAYKADWEELFSKMKGPVEFEVSALSITASGNLAYSHSFQHLKGEMKDGNAVDDEVRVTDVYQKLGGKWLIMHEHVSVPVDLKTGKADLHSRP